MPTTPTVRSRPTPLHPYPQGPASSPKEGESRDATERVAPPSFGPDAIAVLEGRTFMYSDGLRDVPRGSIGGVLHNDTRFREPVRADARRQAALAAQVRGYRLLLRVLLPHQSRASGGRA